MKRILFDGTIFQDGMEANCSRSGLFIASYEIFRALCCSLPELPDLYVPQQSYARVKAFMDTQDFAQGIRYVIGDGGCEDAEFAVKSLLQAKGAIDAGRSARIILLLLRAWYTAVWAGQRISQGFDFLGRHVLRSRYSCFFSPFYVAPGFVRRSGLRRYTVLYDTIPVLFPEFYPGMEGAGGPVMRLVRSMTSKDWAFAISECTKRDFLKFSPKLRANQVKVIPMGAASRFYPCQDKVLQAKVRAKYGIPERCPYFLSLSTIEPRKNIPVALKAFAEFAKSNGEAVFVIAGSAWPSYRAKWESVLAEHADIRNRIVLPGYVADEDMAPLYSGATAFVYLSLYEGFGLPPLEAMQCGCPVLCSNSSSLPEVIGDATLSVSPDDVQGAAEAMRRLAEDAHLRQDLCERGKARARLFSWDRAAEIIVRTIASGTPGADVESREELARRVWNDRPGSRDKRVAVFSPMPPERTGVADFSQKLHMCDPDRYDVIAKVATGREYKRALADWGVKYNVIPYDFYRNALSAPADYAARVFVVGNSSYHEQIVAEALRTRGESGRFLHFHDALIAGAMEKVRQAEDSSWGRFLSKWYPEKSDLSDCPSESSARDEFCRQHGAMCARVLVERSGIDDVIVNNARCRDLILADLTEDQRRRVKVHELFLPIERIDVKRKVTFPDAKGAAVIGSFGIPHPTKGSELIVAAVRRLNETGFRCRLLLAGFGAEHYLAGLSAEERTYCLPPMDTSDFGFFLSLMASVDVAVQLRVRQHGESSGCISQLLGMGTKLIVNRGFVDEAQEHLCFSVPQSPAVEDLMKAIRQACAEAGGTKGSGDALDGYSFAAASRKLLSIVERRA